MGFTFGPKCVKHHTVQFLYSEKKLSITSWRCLVFPQIMWSCRDISLNMTLVIKKFHVVYLQKRLQHHWNISATVNSHHFISLVAS